MKKYFRQMLVLTLVCCIPFLTALGQVDIQLGTPYKVEKFHSKYFLEKDKKLMRVNIYGKRIVCMGLDAEKLVETGREESAELNKRSVIEGEVEFGNQHYLFYSVYDRKDETTRLYCRQFNFDKLILEEREILILEVEENLVNEFYFTQSFDQSQLLIRYRKKPLKKRDAVNFDVIGFKIYKNNLDKATFDKEITMPYTEKMMDNLSYTINNAGNIFILTEVFGDDNKKREEDKRLEILTIAPKTGNLKSTKINLTEIVLNGIVITENAKGEVILAGFYDEGRKYSTDAKGIFLGQLDENGNFIKKKMYEIPVSILNMYASKREKKKNEKAQEKGKLVFPNLTLKKVVTQDDGSIIIFGEEYYSITTTYTTQNGTYTSTTYYANDILVTKINKDGSLAWMNKIPKSQTSGNYNGVSYYSTSSNKKHYMLYLDNPKNLNLGKDDVPETYVFSNKGHMVMNVLEDAKGNSTKFDLFDIADVEGQRLYNFNLGNIISWSNNQFLIEAYAKGKKDVLVKVTLK